jgi:hypothetical protein
MLYFDGFTFGYYFTLSWDGCSWERNDIFICCGSAC